MTTYIEMKMKEQNQPTKKYLQYLNEYNSEPCKFKMRIEIKY